MRNLVFAVGGLALLAGCSVNKDISHAMDGIAIFHRQLNAGQFDTIYAEADSQFKAGTAQADMVQLLSAIHRKLGDFQSGSQTGWNDNVNTGGHFLTIGYTAKYAGGSAEENFVYRMNGEQAALVGYHINSLALIEK